MYSLQFSLRDIVLNILRLQLEGFSDRSRLSLGFSAGGECHLYRFCLIDSDSPFLLHFCECRRGFLVSAGMLLHGFCEPPE